MKIKTVKTLKIISTLKANAEINENKDCSSVFVEIINEFLNSKSHISFFTNDNSKDLTMLISDGSIATLSITFNPEFINYKFYLCETRLEHGEYFINLILGDKTTGNYAIIQALTVNDIENLFYEIMKLTSTAETTINVCELNKIFSKAIDDLHSQFNKFLEDNNAELID